MANTKVVKQIPDDFDPFLWKCDSCGKEKKYTQEEIDTTHKPYSSPQNHDRDYYITCPFCGKGVMNPPELSSFQEHLEIFSKKQPPIFSGKYAHSRGLKFLSGKKSMHGCLI